MPDAVFSRQSSPETMKISDCKDIAVIGGGAWGTALACTMSHIAPVTLWMRSPLPPGTRVMPRLPQICLPDSVNLTTDFPRKAKAIFLVVPTQALRDISTRLETVLAPGIPVITCCKGMEQNTECLPLEILQQTMPGRPQAVLSGPNFAIEVARNLPAAATLAASDMNFARLLASTFSTPALRLYANTDILGVQIAGAAKNVIAIGAGICMGAGMGENARAALITRALVELGRLVETLGGQTSSLYSLAGIGDLLLTATGPESRNYSIGVALGKGQALKDILAERSTVSEGVLTAPTLERAGREHGVETPIISAINLILAGKLRADEARDLFFERPTRLEAEPARA